MLVTINVISNKVHCLLPRLSNTAKACILFPLTNTTIKLMINDNWIG